MMALLHAAFHRPRSRIYRVVQGSVWVLIVLSVLILAIEPLIAAYPGWSRVLVVADRVLLVVFAVEVCLRIVTFRPPELEVFRGRLLNRVRVHVARRAAYAFTPLILIDIITVLALVPALRGLRAVRLLRLLRSMPVFRYSNPFAGLIAAFERDRLLFAFAFSFLATVVLVGGFSLFLVERAANENIRSISDGLWWALVTITTVGYGDVTPATSLGRLVAGVVMIGGMFTLAMFAGIVGHSLLTSVLVIREEQFRMTSYVNHVVLCGYDSGSRMLLDVLTAEIDPKAQKVVIFDDLDPPADLPPDLTWVQGDPTKESELEKVRLSHAAAVVVAGERRVSAAVADARTLLTLFTIRSFLQKRPETADRRAPLYVVAEILDSENVEHARTAGADEVIETRKIGFSMLAHAVAYHGTATTMSRVLIGGAHNPYVGRVPDELPLPMKFGDLLVALALSKRGGLILGLRTRTGQELINPPKSCTVEQGSSLIYLAERPLLEPPS